MLIFFLIIGVYWQGGAEGILSKARFYIFQITYYMYNLEYGGIFL